MIGWLIGNILEPFWPYIVAAGAMVFAFVSGRSQGKTSEKIKHVERSIKSLKTAKEVRDEVDSTSDDGVNERLQRWNRD